MNELEIYKQLYLLQQEQITALKKALEARQEQVKYYQALVDNGEAIIALQKEIIEELVPPEKKPHLRLV